MRDSFGCETTLDGKFSHLKYLRISRLEEQGLGEVSRLPHSIKVLLEAALRGEDGVQIESESVLAVVGDAGASRAREVPFRPARVLVQDFTGVPAITDLAAMRSAMARLGGEPERINPQVPVDLVIDHSVQVDAFGSNSALALNAEREFERNRERYEFLHWGQQAFENFTVVPPATGICHQVNLEYIAPVVQERDGFAFPDSLVGLDSHTTMIGGLGVLGWGVGGIEAEAVMLGQPIFMLRPEVVGVRVSGGLRPGVTATDLALAVTELLRREGVVGRFVEFTGPGLSAMTLADRATIANMAPEYGATCGYFPVDAETLRFLRATGRSPELIELVECYTKEQGLFRTDGDEEPRFARVLELDLDGIESSLAGPKRPQDRVPVSGLAHRFRDVAARSADDGGWDIGDELGDRAPAPVGGHRPLAHGSVVLAAITSCTNTSNPSVILGAGLLARKAIEAGLSVPPYVKTSLAPGSKVVTDYLRETGLLDDLERLGFHVVGYGCTTCIGNSGPLPDDVAAAVQEHGLVVAGVLSGNRNFEGRIHAQVRASFLASPPLVVAYALAGTVDIDLTSEPLGIGTDGRPVTLADIWPSTEEIAALMESAADPEKYARVYGRLLVENETWNQIESKGGRIYDWDLESTYVREPAYFEDFSPDPDPIRPIREARILALLGDSITTDHISPAGVIPAEGPAGRYLTEHGVSPADFNSFGSRRGNHEVMIRGTFANIRLKNRLAEGKEGGYTTHQPSGEPMTIFDAATRYAREGTPLIVLAGADYGMGSSRDWAAKGTLLLGVRAVIARSFERIHRSNLVGMGVLPLQFREGESAQSLGLSGRERLTIDLGDALEPGQRLDVSVTDESGAERTIEVLCRIDTPVELEYYRNGGILHTVLRRFLRESTKAD